MQPLRPLGVPGTLLRFGIPTAALWLEFELVIPELVGAGLRMPLAWFLSGGVVFVGMFVAGLWSLHTEGAWTWETFTQRTRLRPMRAADWGWALAAVCLIGSCIAVPLGIAAALGIPLDPTPEQLRFPPLASSDRWVLLVWLPFWTFNILGEELWWRGVILPRQTETFGRHAWWIHGLGWLAFHLAFGFPMAMFVIPIVFVQSWVCVRRESTTIGIVIHGLINGPGFVAVALGWL
jgi:membrane protease YdiL (CAAX protease family)